MTQYKPLQREQQPQPRLPQGYGIVRIVYKEFVALAKYGSEEPVEEWMPVFLASASDEHFHFRGTFLNPYGGGPLTYRSRRRAIGYVWRWYRRYGEGGLTMPHHLGPCETGIPGHLYQHERVTVAQAAERLSLSVKDVHWIRRHADIKAHLVRGKERSKGRDFFYNHYKISLAHLEAYLDTHGYKDSYVNVAELRGPRPSLPYVVWCV